MIIDFHTHVFSDKIAQRTIELLSEKGGVPAFSDGTVKGLLSRMEEAGVDVGITLPVLTKPTQFESVNRFAAEINQEFASKERRLISFAGIHPDCEDIDGKMRFIADNGFVGVKIHPDYQDTYINDERYVRILEAAAEYDLTVVTHAGIDVGYTEVHCPPALALEVIRRVPRARMILAHFGGHGMHDAVLNLLCGENVYLDTAYDLRFIGEEAFQKILARHGEDRLLFASDSPWSDIKRDVEIFNSFCISDSAREKILCTNAKKLLRI